MTQPSKVTKAPPKSSGAGFGILLSLLIASAAVIGSYWTWQQSNIRDEVQAELENGVAQLLVTIEKQREDVNQRLQADLQQRNNYNTLQQRLITLESKFAQASQPLQADHWALAEVDYLINTAEHHYRLTQNGPMARSALERAQEILLKHSPSETSAITTEIAHLISQLASNQSEKRAQRLAQLDTLSALTPELPIAKNSLLVDDNVATSDYSLNSTEGWSHYGNALWHDIQQLFRISRPDAPESKKAGPITADIYPLLRQQLALKIDFARLALLSNSPLYRSSLTGIQNLIDSYFDPNNEVVKTQLTTLGEMLTTTEEDTTNINFDTLRQLLATGGGK